MTRSRITAWLTAFILTLTLLSLAPACLLIECNLQQTLQGQVDLGVAFTLEEGVPTLAPAGNTPSSLSERVEQGVAALLAPGQRLVSRLLRWETDLATRLWERLLSTTG